MEELIMFMCSCLLLDDMCEAFLYSLRRTPSNLVPQDFGMCLKAISQTVRLSQQKTICSSLSHIAALSQNTVKLFIRCCFLVHYLFLLSLHFCHHFWNVTCSTAFSFHLEYFWYTSFGWCIVCVFICVMVYWLLFQHIISIYFNQNNLK